MHSDRLPYSLRSPTGAYDRIVCTNCEQRFHPWDTYGVEFVRDYRFGGSKRLSARQIASKAIEIQDFDYVLLKMFVLSILWRADASSHVLLNRVNLGQSFRSALSKIILCGDPGGAEVFPITATLFKTELDQYYMVDPHRQRVDGVNYVWLYVYGGFLFTIKVDRRPSPRTFGLLALDPNEPFRIILRNLSPGERRVF